LDAIAAIPQNMVGPGEVDDDLQPEVAEECSKYGRVIKCLVFEAWLFFSGCFWLSKKKMCRQATG
jgi:hypothetical protein